MPEAATAWLGTWVSAQQQTEPGNLPPAPGLASSTLRQIVQVTLGGERLRVRFSNLFGSTPVTFARARLARSLGASAIDPATDRPLLFAGNASVTIPAGGAVTSDELAFSVPALTNLALTLAFDGAPPLDVTGHPGSRTTSFLQTGEAVSAPSLASAQPVEHWYFASGIDVLAPAAARALVTLGDSITDGRGSTTNHNDRWPNNLARRLLAEPNTALVAVLNQGMGGNRILADGLGPSAASRFERDALGPPGVRWVVVLEGINDITTQTAPVAQRLIDAYRRMIAQAHARGVLIYAGTIMPFQGSTNFTAQGEADRQAVNAWLRDSGEFDGLIDFDAITRNPRAPSQLSAAVDGGDGLHPSAAGYRLMANAVDINLFYGGI